MGVRYAARCRCAAYQLLSICIGVGSYKRRDAIALGDTAWLATNPKIRSGIRLSSEGKTIGVGANWQH
ncbi:YadA-like family protein [Burkholderia sp. ABCPW 14]|uniref:YadA-like family protein n=1 Tax=Burkholderia sp. ABCPW 14 TaxID=1637860 RepID=UPI0018D22F50